MEVKTNRAFSDIFCFNNVLFACTNIDLSARQTNMIHNLCIYCSLSQKVTFIIDFLISQDEMSSKEKYINGCRSKIYTLQAPLQPALD